MIPLDTYVTALQAGHTVHALAQHPTPTEADHLASLDPDVAGLLYLPVEIEAARLRLSWLADDATTLTYDTEIERNLP